MKSPSNEKIAKIWFNEEKGVIMCRTPFSQKFVQRIKSIPKHGRRWNPQSRVWEIEAEYLTNLVQILKECFDEVIELGSSESDGKADTEDLFSVLKKEDIMEIYRTLVKKYHPDHGGDTRVMQVINDVFQRWK